MSRAAPKRRDSTDSAWKERQPGPDEEKENDCCTYRVCFLSVSLQEEPLLLSTALISLPRSKCTDTRSNLSAHFFFLFFFLLNPALFFKSLHPRTSLSLPGSHKSFWKSSSHPVPPPPPQPSSARLHAHAKGSSLPTGHCFHSACVWVSRVSFGPADGSE